MSVVPFARRDYEAICKQYAADVLNGRVVAGELLKLACQRFTRDLERAKRETWPYEWRADLGIRNCAFTERLPHVKGPLAAKKLLLELSPWQVFIRMNVFGWVNRGTGFRRFRRVYETVARKQGKELSLDTLIPTPSGWSTMGEIQVGDELYAGDGSVCRVVAKSEVFKTNTCYEMSFSNGEQVIAGEEHNWITVELNDKSKRPRIRTTKEIAETLTRGRVRVDLNHRVQLHTGIEGREVSLPIGPYTLGAWLADGTSCASQITGHRDDTEIMLRIIAEGYELAMQHLKDRPNVIQYTVKGLVTTLKEIGLFKDKHIPSAYLRASRRQRLHLLQGLMDGDGSVYSDGEIFEYGTISDKLKDGVCELLSSFGIKWTLALKQPTINGIPVENKTWLIKFNAFRDEVPVFSLRRKADRMRYRADCLKEPRSRSVMITGCSEVPSIPTQCLQVDHPSGTYLFGRTMLPTHNSSLQAATGLYMLTADNETGPECYVIASKMEQAGIVWSIARSMLNRTPGLMAAYDMEIAGGNNRWAIFGGELVCRRNQGRFAAKGSNPGDGDNPSYACIDEYHEHKNNLAYEAMINGMGIREQPLLWVITTAGYDLRSPCYELQKYSEDVLRGAKTDDTLFAAIYTLDAEDDPFEERNWIKSNPNLGVSVTYESLREAANEAQQNPAKMNTFLTKRLNVWTKAGVAYFNLDLWAACENKELRLEDYYGCNVYLGLDLADKTDVAAIYAFVEFEEGKWKGFCKLYLPADVVHKGEHSTHSHFAKWASEGYLTLTPGPVIRHSLIKEDLLWFMANFDVQTIAFDAWHAHQLVAELSEAGATVVQVPNTVKHISPAMKEASSLLTSGDFQHDGNPCMTWMMGNVIAQHDNKGNVFPKKVRVEDKIDGPMALLYAITRIELKDEQAESIYEEMARAEQAKADRLNWSRQALGADVFQRSEATHARRA